MRSFTMSRGPASAALLKSSARQKRTFSLVELFSVLLPSFLLPKEARLRSTLNLPFSFRLAMQPRDDRPSSPNYHLDSDLRTMFTIPGFDLRY